MKDALNKIEMYKAVEAVCIAHHQSWNDIQGFGSALSRFASKVTQLDLITDKHTGNDHTIQQLIREIDLFLQSRIDSFMDKVCTLNSQFCNAYQSIRTQIQI